MDHLSPGPGDVRAERTDAGGKEPKTKLLKQSSFEMHLNTHKCQRVFMIPLALKGRHTRERCASNVLCEREMTHIFYPWVGDIVIL